MGCCLSKKHSCSENIPQTQQIDLKNSTEKPNNNVIPAVVEVKEVAAVVSEKKAEELVVEDRKCNDKCQGSSGVVSNSIETGNDGKELMAAEEVDAILIQCGRLSKSGSGNEKRYCGSKRSFDFDGENEGLRDGNEVEGEVEEGRLRRRESRGSSRRRGASSGSKERVEQRSGSKERSGSGRRVSRSPGRRSHSPISRIGNGNGNVGGNGNGKPGKLVSVPATVTSLSIDKSNIVNGGDNGSVKRVLGKRNVGSPRSQSPAKGNQVCGSGTGNGNGRSQSPAKGNQLNGNGRSQSPAKGNQVNGNGRSQCPAKGNQLNGNGRSQSPAKGNQVNGNGNGRSQSPARGNQPSGNGNGGQQLSLSRNGSRKAEKSPYRRTPLNEIDINSLPFQPLANKRPLNKGKDIEENKYVVETVSCKVATQGTHRRTRSRGTEGYEITKTNFCRVNGPSAPTLDQKIDDQKDQLNAIEYDAMVTPIILSGTETLKLSQTLMRSRSARRSRDLDINVDALLTPTPTPTTNYTSLLLQDIQNFHQKKNPSSNSNSIISNTSESTPFTLPPCVSKAHSILEAVADLNSTTRSRPEIANTHDLSKKRLDQFVDSTVKVGNDVVEPSLHKYVTVRKRGGDMNDEESTGSNSIVCNSQQNKVSSSWEPSSVDSTDCWTSKRYSREDGVSPVRFQRHAISDQ